MWKSILFSGGSVSTTGVGLFGFIEFRWRGAELMLGGQPIDPFLVQAGSLVLIILGTWTFVAWLLHHLKHRAVRELEDLQDCGDQMRRLVQDSPARVRLRFIHLEKKYKGWLGEMPRRTPSVENSVLDAANCSETLRAWGYFRGRFMLWHEKRSRIRHNPAPPPA